MQMLQKSGLCLELKTCVADSLYCGHLRHNVVEAQFWGYLHCLQTWSTLSFPHFGKLYHHLLSCSNQISGGCV